MHALLEGGEGPQGVLTDAAPSDPEARPALAGLRVLVTRPLDGAVDLQRVLADAGATVVMLPTVRIDDPPDPEPLRAAAAALASYDWVVLTSANAVSRLASAADGAPGARDALRTSRIAAIGSATAAALREEGIEPALTPESYTGDALADALRARGIRGARLLLARSAIAPSSLPARLRDAGARVDEVPAYTTTVEEASRAPLLELIEAEAVDWITFASSSAVTAWVELVGTRTGGARLAAIGPVTAGTARDLGLPDPVVARVHTREGLVEAIAGAAGRPRPARTAVS